MHKGGVAANMGAVALAIGVDCEMRMSVDAPSMHDHALTLKHGIQCETARFGVCKESSSTACSSGGVHLMLAMSWWRTVASC